METVAEIFQSLGREDTFEVLSESARFLYVYNSTTLIASVGAIVGLIMLGALIWIAISSALKDQQNHSGGGYRHGDYRKRRFTDEQEENEFKFLDLLSMLDETFRKLSVNDFDCQKRAVCEAHLRHAEGKLGPVARRINYIFQKLDDKPLGALEKESADFFSEYFEAAQRGKRNENCFQYYGSCRRSLRDFLLKSADDRGFVE